MTTSQPGEGKLCDARHGCKAHCLIFIGPPLVSTVPLQGDQDQFPQLICILLLFHICCRISLCLLWLDFLQRYWKWCINSGAPGPCWVKAKGRARGEGVQWYSQSYVSGCTGRTQLYCVQSKHSLGFAFSPGLHAPNFLASDYSSSVS